MIVVDTQGPHGAYLLEPLLKLGIPAQEGLLQAGDLAFQGKDNALSVGVEVKRMDRKSTDLIQSLRSGRLAGEQLPKLVGPAGAYDYAWLLVEGPWTHNEDGFVAVNQGHRRGNVALPGKMSAVALEKSLLTLELCGGLHVRVCPARRDTLRFLLALYRWFSDVDFDRHTSHLAIHRPPTLVPLTPFEEGALGWPGVGRAVARAAEKSFGSIKRAVNGSPVQWAALETVDKQGKTRQFGMKAAEKLIAYFRQGEL